MPIRPDQRWLYPIDWRELSAVIRFDRAGGACERCRRPHCTRVAHLGDGRWWDAGAGCWRSEKGRRIALRRAPVLHQVRTTYVVLACAHLDHDPGNNAPTNLAALCQRCHMRHDAAEHRWQRWWNAFRTRALRDLYEDPPAARRRLPCRGDRPSVLLGGEVLAEKLVHLEHARAMVVPLAISSRDSRHARSCRQPPIPPGGD